MDLERHLRVMWNHRAVVVGGMLLAILLACLATFQVRVNNGLDLKRRGTEEWSSTSVLLVTQRGFPWGRVTLPGLNLSDPTEKTAPDAAALKFADPTRFSNLAMLYSVIAYSDQVRARLPERPSAGQIQAIPLDPTGRGNVSLPVFSLTTKAARPEGALTLNQEILRGLRAQLLDEQNRNAIPASDRVAINVLNEPQPPLLLQGRSMTSGFLAVLLSLAGTIALAHILEAAAMARRRREEEALALGGGYFDQNGPAEPSMAAAEPAVSPTAGGGRWRAS